MVQVISLALRTGVPPKMFGFGRGFLKIGVPSNHPILLDNFMDVLLYIINFEDPPLKETSGCSKSIAFVYLVVRKEL